MKHFINFRFLRFIAFCTVILMLLSLSACDLPDIYITLPDGYVVNQDGYVQIPEAPVTQAPEKVLVKEHVFRLSGTHTVRGGYVSGSTSPSVSVNLAEVFDLQALAESNYTCTIEVEYYAKVNGDHLNIRCSLSGTANSSAAYVYLDHNEGASLEHIAYNISGSSYANNPVLYIKWDCEGVTFMDGLNECDVSDVTVKVKFS